MLWNRGRQPLSTKPGGAVRIRPRSGRSQGSLIVDPRVDDDPGARIETEEHAEPSSKLRPTPVAMCRAKRVSLAVLLSRRIAWNRMQKKVTQCAKEPHVRITLEPRWILSPRSQGRGMKPRKLLDDALVEQQRPAIDLHQSSTSPSNSSGISATRPALSSMARARSSGRLPMWRP